MLFCFRLPLGTASLGNPGGFHGNAMARQRKASRKHGESIRKNPPVVRVAFFKQALSQNSSIIPNLRCFASIFFPSLYPQPPKAVRGVFSPPDPAGFPRNPSGLPRKISLPAGKIPIPRLYIQGALRALSRRRPPVLPQTRSASRSLYSARKAPKRPWSRASRIFAVSSL